MTSSSRDPVTSGLWKLRSPPSCALFTVFVWRMAKDAVFKISCIEELVPGRTASLIINDASLAALARDGRIGALAPCRLHRSIACISPIVRKLVTCVAPTLYHKSWSSTPPGDR